ncbi:MAG: hypothetical protein ACREUM_04825, partial [Nitrosospira sp.]
VETGGNRSWRAAGLIYSMTLYPAVGRSLFAYPSARHDPGRLFELHLFGELAATAEFRLNSSSFTVHFSRHG